MSKQILILPFKNEDSTILEPSNTSGPTNLTSGTIDLPPAYPKFNTTHKEVRRPLNDQAFDDEIQKLQQNDKLPLELTFLIKGTRASLLVGILDQEPAIPPAKQTSKKIPPGLPTITAAVKTMIALKLGIESTTGLTFVKQLSIEMPIERAIKIIQEGTIYPEEYTGNENQIKLAKKMGGTHLGALYNFVSACGLAKGLKWTKMNVKLETCERFQEAMKHKNKYKGNLGQLRLAKKLGNINLGDLLGLASGLGFMNQLGWSKLTVPVKTAQKFLEIMESKEKYHGNSKQLEVAKELGKLHLGDLYRLAAGFEYAESLGWTMMNVSYEVAEKFQEKIPYFQKYKSVNGYIKLAHELGEIGLGQLYSLASGLGHIEKLEWSRKIDVPYSIVKLFEDEMRNPNKYKGNRKQIELAGKLGKIHLSHLFGLAQGLGYIEKLGWTMIEVPFDTVEKFEKEMKQPKQYHGNLGQIKLAKKLGEIDLGSLFSLANGLGYAGLQEWTCLRTSYENSQRFLKIMATPKDFSGNLKQIEIAGLMGKINLMDLFALASGLGYAQKLGWICLHVSYDVAKEFIQKMSHEENYKGKEGKIKLAAELGNINEISLHYLATGLGYMDELKWKEAP